MFDQSLFKSKALRALLRFVTGVVVQGPMSLQGMADLYRIKPDLLEYFIKSNIVSLRYSPDLEYRRGRRYTLDDYLSGFLQDRERSQRYYCDPMLQHISICRHFLSLLDGLGSGDALDLQS